MASLGSLIISLEANTAKFESSMSRAAYITQQSANQIQKSMDNITSTLKGMVIAAISIESINRVWEGFKNIYDAEKALEKMAIRLGTASSELSALQYAGKKSGIEIDVFNNSIQRMEKNISMAAIPTKNVSSVMGELGEETAKGSEAFRNLGINVSVLKTLPLKDQLLAISERLNLIPNETDKVRIALDIFGKGGGGMLVMLKAGEEAIDAWITKGRQLGVVLDDSMIKRGANASKSISEMSDGFKGLGITLADILAPTVKDVTEAFTNKLIAIRAADPGLQNLTSTVKEFGAAWAEPVLNALKMGVIGSRIAGLQGAAIGAAAGFMGLTTSLRELADVLQNPLILAFLGGAAGSRLGGLGAVVGAATGAVTGITWGIQKDAAAYKKSQEEDFSGYETPMGDFAPDQKIELQFNKTIDKYKDLFTQPSYGKGGGKAGGRSGGDTGEDRMGKIVDDLLKAKAKLEEGSLAEIEQWAEGMRNEIAKVAAKGSDPETALKLVSDVEMDKQKKSIDEFNLFVAKESGNTQAIIEAQAKDWERKCKGHANAELEISKIKNLKLIEDDLKRKEAAAGFYATVLNQMVAETPLLTEQLSLKKQILPYELEMNRLAQERAINQALLDKTINESQASELRGLQALAAQMKKNSLEREDKTTGGYAKGLADYSTDLTNRLATLNYDQMLSAMKTIESSLGSGIADYFINTMKGKKNSFTDLGNSMAETFIKSVVQGWVTRMMPLIEKAASALVNAATGSSSGLSGLLGLSSSMSTSNLDAVYSTGAGTTNAYNVGYSGNTMTFSAAALGGIFERGVKTFASGGLVNSPTIFPMASGYGLMGEDGPEAILPLTRTSSGDLGVAAVGGNGGSSGPLTVNIINNTGTQANARVTQSGDDLTIQLEAAIDKSIRGGAGHSALRQTFGLTPTVTQR